MFDDDHAVGHQGGRYRWLVSTCIAGAIGFFAIFAIIAGSTDRPDGEGFMPALERLRSDAMTPELIPRPKKTAGLTWAIPKTDKLDVSSGLISTRYVIQETLRQRREGRSYIGTKPYLRMVARLAPVPSTYKDVIPPFNPLQLYADDDPIGPTKGSARAEREDVKLTVVELIGGVLPQEDGQKLDDREVEALIKRFLLDEALAAVEVGENVSQETAALINSEDDESAFTSKVDKNLFEETLEAGQLVTTERVKVTVSRGDTIVAILEGHGASAEQAGAMIDAMKSRFTGADLKAGQQIVLSLEPSRLDSRKFEPSGYSIMSETGEHIVSVSRNASGTYAASATPLRDYAALRGLIEQRVSGPTASSLYASVFHSALLQNVPQETILKILRINAYQTDFGRRIAPGDTLELFFDFEHSDFTVGPPGDLLYTNITTGGESAKFYRFRTDDGEVDYYDEQGNNSKRFLTRKPVLGSNVRLSSGYGMRYHPLLNRRRMHAGVDWAGPKGTPILAAGRGVIEEAGRKGQYGNYVRIRHANGYKTSYAHMHRFARGVQQGAKVRQGQIIGFIGSTGLSSGPHLHFEVFVNDRHVNPMTIKVPRERQLKGRELVEFQRERARIEELMRRAPVMTINR